MHHLLVHAVNQFNVLSAFGQEARGCLQSHFLEFICLVAVEHHLGSRAFIGVHVLIVRLKPSGCCRGVISPRLPHQMRISILLDGAADLLGVVGRAPGRRLQRPAEQVENLFLLSALRNLTCIWDHGGRIHHVV